MPVIRWYDKIRSPRFRRDSIRKNDVSAAANRRCVVFWKSGLRKSFPEIWELNEPIRPEKRWAKAGKIFLSECGTQAGWIVLGWDAKKESKP